MFHLARPLAVFFQRREYLFERDGMNRLQQTSEDRPRARRSGVVRSAEGGHYRKCARVKAVRIDISVVSGFSRTSEGPWHDRPFEFFFFVGSSCLRDFVVAF
jgi:hypothetical protein